MNKYYLLLAEIFYFLWCHSLLDKLALMPLGMTEALGLKIRFKLGMSLC